MKGWLIFGIILLILWLIGMIRAQIELGYNGELTLRVKALGLTFGIMPKKPPKKIDPDDFSLKKYRKLLKKEANRQAKKDARKRKKQAKAAKKKKDKQARTADRTAKKPQKKKGVAELLDLVCMLLDALKSLGKSFGKHFEIEVVKLRITVGSEDAAQTALLYGTAVQALAYLLEWLSMLTNLRIKKQNRGDVLVEADFTSEQIQADLHLIFKLRVWHLLAMLFSALGAIIKNRIAGLMNASKPSPASASDSRAGSASTENS